MRGLATASRLLQGCLLYTSDAADDLLCVDLGGRRIIKKKTPHNDRYIKQYTACRIIRYGLQAIGPYTL